MSALDMVVRAIREALIYAGPELLQAVGKLIGAVVSAPDPLRAAQRATEQIAADKVADETVKAALHKLHPEAP